MHSKQDGFTFIEMLIVLAIVTIIISVVSFQFKPQTFGFEKAIFLSQFQSDLYMAQQYAISHQREVNILIQPDLHRYVIDERPQVPSILIRTYSNNISFRPGSLPLFFKYSPEGNISQFGSFFIDIDDRTYKMTMFIGKGRFQIVEV